ncbi:unnamed protein product [Auanema sp. JU1783]|nr:unnamed protein product [Auanema sp. JU1783]
MTTTDPAAPPCYYNNSISQSSITSDRSDSKRKDSQSQSSVLGPKINAHGLGWFVTGLFVVGDLAGGGLVALPTAMIQSEFWGGLVITVVMTLVVTYTAYVLGKCWNILLDHWPEYHEHCRKPYPEIGYRAMGPVVRLLVSICIDVTQFGIAVVYLLLSSKNIHDFTKAFFGGSISFCYVIIILAICLLPITFLKSPQDFWWAVVIAMITTSCAVVLICIGAGIDYSLCESHRHMPDIKVTNFFLALGTFLFAYGGHSAFPTIQHDMRNPRDFTKSVMLAFSIMAFMYVPVCIMGYLVYGDSLRDSIIPSIQNKGIQQAINVLITIHCILTLTIVFNPLNQEIEDLLRVPQNFGWKRVATRTTIMAAVVFVAESVPTFGPLLDLVGGSTLTLTSVILPCLFYLYLSAARTKETVTGIKNREPCSFSEVFKYSHPVTLGVCCGIIVFGLLGGGAATYSALKELSTTQFSKPCYVTAFQHHDTSAQGDSHTNCCGVYQNISHSGISCSAYDRFYA